MFLNYVEQTSEHAARDIKSSFCYGTGAFDMVELEVGKRAAFVARRQGHWGGGANIERFEIIDIGEDSAAQVGALASKQVDMIYQGAIATLPARAPAA